MPRGSAPGPPNPPRRAHFGIDLDSRSTPKRRRVDPPTLHTDLSPLARQDARRATSISPTTIVASAATSGGERQVVSAGGARRVSHPNPTSPLVRKMSGHEPIPEAQPLPMSIVASRTVNQIRAIVDTMNVIPNPDLPVILLSLGDPTVHGAFEPSPVMARAVADAVMKGGFEVNGYLPSVGRLDTRESISTLHPGSKASDVIVTSGCSHALEIAITGTLNPGESLLVPQPGFPLYETIAKARGINIVKYRLDPEAQWQINLDHLEKVIDSTCKVLVVNNPSNPCGSVFSQFHLEDILKIARKHKLLIIADEIYGDMVFPGVAFHPLASLSKHVPIVTVSGLAKQYLVPGWRLGWIVTHDPTNVLSQVQQGFAKLTTLILGACSVMQAAVPAIINNISPSFKADVTKRIHDNAEVVIKVLSRTAALSVIRPRGAMYVMVHVHLGHLKDISTELQFTEKLFREKSVMVLPGSCFGAKDFVRIVLTPSKEKLEEACNRILDFTRTHMRR